MAAENFTFALHRRLSLMASNPSFAAVHAQAAADATAEQSAGTAYSILDTGIYFIRREEIMFDTAELAGYTIVSATLMIQVRDPGLHTEDDPGQATLYVVQGVNNVEFAAADYGLLKAKTTPGGDGIPFSEITDAYQGFSIVLYTAALRWINRKGYTSFGIRIAGDLNNTPPTGRNDVSVKYVSLNGGGGEPALVVEAIPSSGGIYVARQIFPHIV